MAKGGRRLHAGPKRKPTELKVLQGTFRADRHGAEPSIPVTWPRAPRHLNARERTLWRGLKAHCASWVAPSDQWALNGVVSLADRLLRNQDAQRTSPAASAPILKTSAGVAENPLLSQELKLWRELRAYLGIVGLSPVDRARVQTPGASEEPASPLDKFIRKGQR
jgi:hypothetical protein